MNEDEIYKNTETFKMFEIKKVDFNISEAIGNIQRGIPSAIQPRMARSITYKIFDKHRKLEMFYSYEKEVRKAILKTIDKYVMPTLSGLTEIIYDNYVFKGEDLKGFQPQKGKEEQTLFYKNYVYKKFRHPCNINFEDFYVYDLENKTTKKVDLVEKDFLIVDDKGVVRYLFEDTIKLFEKLDKPYYIGEKVKD